MYNEEPHALNFSPDAIRVITSSRMRWMEHEAHVGKTQNPDWVLVETAEEKRPSGRLRHRWMENTKTYLGDGIVYDGMD